MSKANKYRCRLTTVAFVCLFLVQCTAYRLANVQDKVDKSFEANNYERAEKLLTKNWENNTYQRKDRVLYYLELGTVKHFSGEYQESFEAFNKAEESIDELFTKSISRGIKSFAINDNALAYDGEDYEDIYLNVFNSLNFIQMNDLESALVEARRIAFKLDKLNIKYKGLVGALAKEDTTGIDEWEQGKSNIQNSALGHFLSGVLYNKAGDLDDARIQMKRTKQALKEQENYYDYKLKMPDSLINSIGEPNSFNVMIVAFGGQAPIKRQYDTRVYIQEHDFYLKFSLPKLQQRPSEVRSVRAVINENEATPVYKIEEMDKVASEIYKVKMPIIYARTMVRALTKALSTKALSKKAEEESKALGELVSILGGIGQEASEKADLRGWQTMPGDAYVTLLNIPEGSHDISLEYHGPTTILHEEKHTIEVTKERNSIYLVEGIYSN